MKYFFAQLTFLTLSLAKITDAPRPFVVQILDVALLAEHLESAFYRQALKRFEQPDFSAAGLPDWARGHFQQSELMSWRPVNTTSISPSSDPSFASAPSSKLSVSLLTLAALQFVDAKDYVTIAGGILAVEARHAVPLMNRLSWINSVVQHNDT
ncbi:hypothetical protein B0H16DRAFT_1718979 [Mycena metata]|uniref:Uncharacterized protein n=1 Tax=Mycena metata TaxID=1033252 RepID=A0AAD7JFC0_9AGAR|nr:hypothetical protein B0H16DRAFT_1718979 [Mycena metata]